MRTLSVMSCAKLFKPSAMPILGLATKSTAPNSSARKVASALRSVRVDTITTGIGRRRIRRLRNSMPSMLGISMSSVSTSGLRLRIISRAMRGSPAAPTQCMSGCVLMMAVSRPRTRAESSMTRTLVFLVGVCMKGAR